MARIRTIKPEFPQSESMGRVSRDARLLFIMLWTIADDSGRARAASRMLASLLFPYDDDAALKIPEWLMELERQKCVRVYCIDGNTYLQIEKWTTHQKIDKPSASKLPSPPERSRKPREGSPKGREGSSGDLVPSTKDLGSSIAHSRSLTDFEKFWEEFPKKVSKGDARKAYAKAVTRASPDQILAAAAAYARQRKREDPKFTQYPATWLNADGWLNEGLIAEMVDPAKAEASRDRADFLLKRGKYAEALNEPQH